MNTGKQYANKGVERNKKPLENIVYKITVSNKSAYNFEKFQPYNFKELGYLILFWQYEKQYNEEPTVMNWHGLIAPDELKKRLSKKQWDNFCQGERIFIIQRRIDWKNIKKEKK